MSELAADSPAPGPGKLTQWFDNRFRSPAAIYGLIVFAAFITIESDKAHDAWDMLDTAVWTLLVFFIAHVFAHTLTGHGEHGLGASTRHAIVHASGMLYAAIPASIVLIICGLQGIAAEDAYEASMWITVIVLGVLGYVAYWRRGAHPFIRLLGAVGTAILGASIVLLEYLIH